METENLLTGRLRRGSPDYGSESNHGRSDALWTRRMSYSVSGGSCTVEGDDEALYIQQAVVFIEDAIQYRSINHRVDASSLRLYRWYYSRICQWGLGLTIAMVLMLAFVERPSSLSASSDPRYHTPPWEPACGLTESIEMVCLFIFSLDLAVKSYLIGWEEFRKSKWLIGYMLVLTASTIDWVLTVSMECDEKLRVRRLIRPFFLLQNSSLMKKTLKCIKRTLPEIASVFLLLALHLCLFTMIAMLLFIKTEDTELNGEWELYFRSLPQTLTSLLVLLTTANNPDVMIPAYTFNRGYSLFFIIFSVFGTFFLMNLLTAIIYNQFRGYLLMSVQTSVIRRRLGIMAAFQVLTCLGANRVTEALTSVREHVYVDKLLEVLSRVQMKSYYKVAIIKEVQQYAAVGSIERQAFGKLFDELDKDRIKNHPPLPQYESPILQKLQVIFSHYYVTIVGNAMALANVICICAILVLNSEKSIAERDDYYMKIINSCFIVCYLLEISLKIFAFSWKGYISYRHNIFDGLLIILLLVLQIAIFAAYKLPYPQWEIWEMNRVVNLLIVFRFLRIIPDIKLMALVASTLLDLVKNLRAFAGILVVVYYVFAVFGIWLFEGAIKPPPPHMSLSSKSTMENTTTNFTLVCGTYEQLGYWPNNFDDFAAAIVLLYNVMVVNNWQAFMDVYSRYTTEWAKVYFVCWWLTSSVMWVNLFVALILENFIYKWDRSHSCSVTEVERTRYESSVQLMFKEQIQEPTEEELLTQLHQHPHLRLL